MIKNDGFTIKIMIHGAQAQGRDRNTLNNNERNIRIMKNNGQKASKELTSRCSFINYVNMLLAMINTNIHSN